MAVTSSIEMSVQLLSADGSKSKLLKIPNPNTDTYKTRASVIEKLAPLTATYTMSDQAIPGSSQEYVGVFVVDGVPLTQFGEIKVISKVTSDYN